MFYSLEEIIVLSSSMVIVGIVDSLAKMLVILCELLAAVSRPDSLPLPRVTVCHAPSEVL